MPNCMPEPSKNTAPLCNKFDLSKSVRSTAARRKKPSSIGPLALQHLDKPFRGAIGAGRVVARAHVAHAVPVTRRRKYPRAIAAPVIAQYPSDRDAACGKPSQGPVKTPRSSCRSGPRALRHIHAALVIGRDVHVTPTQCRAPWGDPRGCHGPLGNRPRAPDIDMQETARGRLFIR